MADQSIKLIIEAVNRSQAGFDSLRADLAKIAAGTESLNSKFSGFATQCNQFKSGFGVMAIEFNALVDAGRRLAGIFTPVIKTALDYNKQIEMSGLGISAIITSMTDLKDAQGNVLTGAAKWQESTRYTAQVQGDLQKIAMTTAVTYQELVAAYQGILAPALSAKMNFKDITEFTGLMANSVKAIGLPMQQIVQESRDLVAGTIDQNSQLSKSLGITNEDVKKWREKGTVFDEVKKRLVGFVYASNEFSNTWEGAWSNFKDVAQRALGEGLKPAFDGLRGQIGKITEQFVTITKDNKGTIIDMQIKPEVMASLKNISFEFNRIVEFSKQFAGILTTIAEPALFTAIVSGFGKVALALEGVGIAAQTANRFLAGSVIGAMVMASYSLVKGGIDASKDAADVDSVKSIYSNIGGKPGGEIDNLTPSLYRKVVDKTALTPEQMALALKQKQLWLYPQTLDSSEDFIFKQKEFDAAATARQKPSGTLTPHKTPPTKEQIAEANAEAIAAAGLVRQTSNDATELSLKTDLSAVKEKLRQRKILYEKGSIDANQWIEDQKDAKDQEIALEEYAIVTTQAALTAEWIAKREHYAKKSDLDKAYQAYTKEWNKLDLDHKLTHDKNSAALDDAELARIAEAGKRKKQTLAENLKAIDDQAKSYQRVLETKRASGTISASGYETALVLSQQQAALSKRSTLSEAIDAGGKPEVLQALRTDLAGVDEELIRLGLTAEKLSLERDWFAGMKRGLQGYTDSAMNLGAQLEAAFGNAFKGMEDALVKFATTGKLNFTDMANSIISDLIRIQIRASITGPLSSALSSGIASLVGGIGGAAVSGAGYGTPVSPETYGGTVFSGSAAVYNSAGVQPVAPTAAGPFVVKHEGGMIVPRFHFGGLASDEVPAILQTRERVLSREQNTIFENFVNTTSAPSSQNVRVEIVNPPGQKNAAASSNATFDAEGMVIGIILKNIDSGGALRQVFAR